MRKSVIVRGPCLTQSGYGEHARMVLRALRSREDLFDIFIIPTGWGQTGWIFEQNEFRTWTDAQILKTQQYLAQKLPFDISIQIAIPNEWERLAPINIGVCAGIETTKVSPGWLEKANEMDKVIVVSEHSKWGFENTAYDGQDQHGNPVHLELTTPVEVVGYPARNIEPDPEFNLELEYDFNYLAVGQWGPRKNLDNLIRWWLEECWDQEVGLVIKTSHRRNNIMDREYTKNRLKYVTDSLELDKEDRKCKVYLLHGDLTEAEMSALYHHPKISCMATTTHGEGFGLPLFEFAQVGKPIIAPEWSGHLDFLVKDKTSCFLPVNYDIQQIQKEAVWDGVIQADSMWAFPHEGSFKQRVRQVRKGGKWLKRAQQLQEWVLEEFNSNKQHQLFADLAYGEEVDMSAWFDELNSGVVEHG